VLGLLATAAAACIRPPARQDAPPVDVPAAEAPAWDTEASALLSDAIAALRVCDSYAAYRVSASSPASSGPIWDPPTGSAWQQTQQLARGFGQRADQLFQAIATSPTAAAPWRDRRALAAGGHELVDMASALSAYLARADHFAPDGDGTGGLDLLKAAWAHWDAGARAWGMERSEAINCA
jgi:hypothetical protein